MGVYWKSRYLELVLQEKFQDEFVSIGLKVKSHIEYGIIHYHSHGQGGMVNEVTHPIGNLVGLRTLWKFPCN